jgi:hypothetical protein
MNRKYEVVLTASRRDPQKDHVKCERTVLWAFVNILYHVTYSEGDARLSCSLVASETVQVNGCRKERCDTSSLH